MKILDTLVRQPKKQVRQPKQQVWPISMYAVLSQGNFMHFSGIQFTGQKMRWRPKNDKYEVCVTAILNDNKDNDNDDDGYVIVIQGQLESLCGRWLVLSLKE